MEKIKIETRNETSISATHYKTDNQDKAIIISAATGVPQGYYSRISEYYQSQGYGVLTFDYTGIGESGDIKVKSNMSDWGRFDLDACIDWAKNKYQNVYVIGHSVGGQIFPFVSDPARVKAAYFVASQSAFWKHWEGLERLKVLYFWYFVVPVLTRVFGYLPNWGMKSNGEHLPSLIAREWMSWGKHPEGVLQGLEERKQLFGRIKLPVRFVSVDDDHNLAPASAVIDLMKQYSKAKTSHEHLVPEEYNLKKVGHFGFFKERVKEQLWNKPLEFFNEHS